MTHAPKRLPLFARALTTLIVGADSDVLRGDLEEMYLRRLADEGDSLRLRAAYVVDTASSTVRWWWMQLTHRSATSSALANDGGLMTTFGPDLRQMWRGLRRRPGYAAMVALTLGLGIGASLLFRSFVHLRSERLGFEPQGLVTFSVAFKTPRPWETWNTVLEQVATIPGLTAVGGASNLPFQQPTFPFEVAPAEQSADTPIAPVAGYAVSPTFFATAKVPILRGRAFDSSDQPDSRRVVIINDRFARTTFGERDPIGQLLRKRDEGSWTDLEVVGVVGDVVQARVEDGVLPAIYLPYTQMFAAINVLAVTRRSPEELAPEIRRTLAQAGLGRWPVLGISSMHSRIGESLSAPRFQLLLIVGLTAGLIGAVGLTRLLQGFLYRVSPIDPAAFLVALVVVVVAVVAAALRPAGRAARVDPIASIRAVT